MNFRNMMTRLKEWMIRKLGGVPKDTYLEEVGISKRYQARLFRVQQERLKIIPVYARINPNHYMGSREGAPDYYQRELTDLISDQLFSCGLITIEQDSAVNGGLITARLEVVDRRKPHG